MPRSSIASVCFAGFLAAATPVLMARFKVQRLLIFRLLAENHSIRRRYDAMADKP
jgi:hypothetical protein